MSRPSLGAEHVEKLEGAHEAKARLKVILRVMSGEITLNLGAEQLGVCPSRFHELRDEALLGALEALAPKAPGRPRSEQPSSLRELELAEELDEARYQLEVERVRTRILLTMPGVIVGKVNPPRVERGGRGGGGTSRRS